MGLGERTLTALLLCCRRWVAIPAFLALAAPLVIGLVHPDDPVTILKEGRQPTPLLHPHTFTDWMWFSTSVDAYLRDRFGLRQSMIDLYNYVFTSPAVLIGQNGRMFYRGDQMVRQSAGRLLRDAKVAETADLVATMRAALAKRSIAFLVAIPPNSSTIYEEDLPGWAQNSGRTTEYDLFLTNLRERGVKTVDLRPALKLARSQGAAYFRYDTHWTPRGAIAGFNAVIEASGHPDWRIDPATALGPSTPRKGGDVARILGREAEVTEMAELFTLPLRGTDQPITQEPMPDHVVATGKPGPTVMVIGDSFTQSFFSLLLSQHLERVVWIHHHHCGFDWSLMDKFHPDEVWWMPTERYILCQPGVHPVNFVVESMTYTTR
jgi:alginate O-acetyltransferase complex protein AlgJ